MISPTTTSALWGVMKLLQGGRLHQTIAASVALLAAQSAWDRAQSQSTRPILDAVRFEVTAVTDSAQYLLYEYRIVISTSSRGGVAGLSVDLSAPLGTGLITLPFTGDLQRSDGGPHAPDHVPVGGIAPDRWKMMVVYYRAHLDWYAADFGVVTNGTGLPASADSAPPGGSKAGFGLRSSYLPGIRRFSAHPTYQSCCTQPNDRGEYPNPSFFPATGFTVAPTVRPQDMGLSVVQSDLQRVCGSLRWITDGAVCGSLRSKLKQATQALQRSDSKDVKGSLRAFLAELDARHGPGMPVSDNAYWLLKVNGEYLLAHM